MNWSAIRAIYVFEMARFFRTLAQSVISPVLSTSLYFVVFGAAIGSRIAEVEDLMGAVVFLASDAAAMMTGTSLLIDGGWTAS